VAPHNFVFGTIYVEDFAVDDQCNLYLVGHKKSAKTFRRFAVEKYDRNGKKCWEDIYEVLPGGYGYADRVELDVQGNVYVAGFTNVPKSNSVGKPQRAVALIKYSPDGKILWNATYRKPGYQLGLMHLNVLADTSVCVLIDSTVESDDIPDPRSYSFRALTYDAFGKKVRQNMLGGYPVASASIGESSLCVVERTMDFTDALVSSEYSIIEFDAEGNRSVLKTVSTKGGPDGPETGALIPRIMGADLRGNFYVAGSCRLSPKAERRTVAAMFSHGGDQLWRCVLPVSVGVEDPDVYCGPDALAVDDAGGVYLADWFRDVLESREPVGALGAFSRQKVNRLTISKCSRRGVNEWNYEHKTDKKGVRRIGPVLLKVLDSGNVLCISLIEGPGFTADFYVIVLASNGKKVFNGMVRKPSDWVDVVPGFSR
jgi:hypothetical protein